MPNSALESYGIDDEIRLHFRSRHIFLFFSVEFDFILIIWELSFFFSEMLLYFSDKVDRITHRLVNLEMFDREKVEKNFESNKNL